LQCVVAALHSQHKCCADQDPEQAVEQEGEGKRLVTMLVNQVEGLQEGERVVVGAVEQQVQKEAETEVAKEGVQVLEQRVVGVAAQVQVEERQAADGLPPTVLLVEPGLSA